MFTIDEASERRLGITASGRLDEKDYETLIPRLEDEIERRGALRLLIRLRDFEGWTPKGLVDDLRFDLRHHDDFARVAVVGTRAVEKWGTKLSAPFFSGEMRYFENEDEARAWLG